MRLYPTLSSALVAWVFFAPSVLGQCTRTPRLTGSFVQPWLVSGWAASGSGTMDTSLGYLQEVCITTSVLQWTVDPVAKTVAYPSSMSGYRRMSSSDLVEELLAAADKKNMRVFVGLQLGSDWFDNSANNPTWLNASATLSKQIASELQAKYSSHKSFQGWYLPFELDNLNFQTTTTQDRMAAFYKDVITHLKTLAPTRPVAIAPFFNPNVGMGPSGWQSMWTRILKTAPVDIISLQDGCGAGGIPTSALPTWFSATKNAIVASRPSTTFLTDTETFRVDPTTGGFRVEGWTKILADMNAAKPYVSDFWAFSYDHYQLPTGFSPAYHEAYKRYLSTGLGDSTKPSTPAAPKITGRTITWTASTDNLAVAGYEVYRNNTLIGYANSYTAFLDSGAASGQKYAYTITAFDAFGNKSPMGPATVTAL